MVTFRNIGVKLIVATILSGVLVLASCSKDNETLLEELVTFGVAIPDGWNEPTRGTVLTENLLYTSGFGVFAHYTGKSAWSAYDQSQAPNFMNNTKVTSSNSGTSWKYAPLKYWPHDKADRVSFLAYAPYVSSYELNDSKIAFEVNSDVSKQLDLCWSVSNTLDLHRGNMGNNAVTFDFMHALSRIGFTVKATANGVAPLPAGMTMKMKRVMLTAYTDDEGVGEQCFYATGDLNLCNTADTPDWSNRTLGKSFSLTANNFVGKRGDGFVMTPDNTSEALRLNADDSYLMVIPQDFSTNGFNIYIEYEVSLKDPGGHDYFTYINCNTGNIKLNLEAGKAYVININIDLEESTVELVSITEWVDGGGVLIPGIVS